MITCIRRSDGARLSPAEVRELFPVVNRKGPLKKGERTPWGYKFRPTAEELNAIGFDRVDDGADVTPDRPSDSGYVESYKLKAELRAQGLFDPVESVVFESDDNIKDAWSAAFFVPYSVVAKLIQSALVLNDQEMSMLFANAARRKT